MNTTRKSLAKPRKIKAIEAAIRRLPPNYSKLPLLEKALGKYNAGYKGEQTVEYYLNFITDQNYRVFHDLRLLNKNAFAFQMDCLLLSTRIPILLEVKYITGIIKFDPIFNQMIRTQNGVMEAFPNPITQVALQKRRLHQWLTEKMIPQFPQIETLVVFTNPYAILETDVDYYEAINKVILCHDLPQKLEDIYRRNKEIFYTEKEIDKIENNLLKNHTPEKYNVLAKFDIPESHISKGIYCERCRSFLVKKQARKWICIICGEKSTDSYLSALKDYALLHGPSITNRQLRDFLHLPSISVASKILISLDLPYSGSYKNRVYYLPEDE